MVTRFSDLTLDNTPGAGSYVPYVDPTEAVAADRSKRILVDRLTHPFDPRFFGAVFDGSTDDSAAWQSAITAAAAAGQAVTIGVGGTSLIDATVTNLTGTPMYGFGVVTIKPGPNVTEVFNIGDRAPFETSVALTADAAVGDSTVTMGSTASFTVGDLVAVVSNTVIPGHTTHRTAQIAVVLSKTGTTLELDVGLNDALLTAATARAYPVTTTKGFRFSGFKWASPTSPTQEGRNMVLSGLRDAKIDSMFFESSEFIPIITSGCADTAMVDLTVDNETDEVLGYGVSIGLGLRQSVTRMKGTKARHLVTTLYQAFDGGSELYGGPVDTTVSDSVATRSHLAGFDEHEGAVGTKFINCTANDGEDVGFQIRGRNSELSACTGRRNLQSGVRVTLYAIDAKVSGIFSDNTQSGVGVQAGATRVTIQASLDRNGVTGLSNAGTDTHLIHSEIRDNGDYGVQDVSGVRLIVSQSYMPASASQTISVLDTNGSVVNNTLTGYGSGDDGTFGGTPISIGNAVDA